MKKSHSVVAVIPARGGSKGIPYKNLQLLAGKPLVSHTITHALKAKKVNRVIVSTDNDDIVDVSKQFGAEVILRPKELSSDTASSEAALLHVLDYLNKKEGRLPDLLAFLQCTSPLTLPEDIDGTIDALLDNQADTSLAVIPFHYFIWSIDESGTAIGINHDKNIRKLRQEREQQYLEAGAVYVMRVNEFIEKKHRFFGKTALYVMPANRCLEIDEPNDLKLAEILMSNRNFDLNE